MFSAGRLVLPSAIAGDLAAPADRGDEVDLAVLVGRAVLEGQEGEADLAGAAVLAGRG